MEISNSPPIFILLVVAFSQIILVDQNMYSQIFICFIEYYQAQYFLALLAQLHDVEKYSCFFFIYLLVLGFQRWKLSLLGLKEEQLLVLNYSSAIVMLHFSQQYIVCYWKVIDASVVFFSAFFDTKIGLTISDFQINYEQEIRESKLDAYEEQAIVFYCDLTYKYLLFIVIILFNVQGKIKVPLQKLHHFYFISGYLF